MDFDTNFQKKAFCRLASSDLSETELSLLFYFFSKGPGSFASLLIKPLELSSFLHKEEKNLIKSLFFLQERKIIKINEKKSWKIRFQKGPFGVSLNSNVSEWLLPKEEKIYQEENQGNTLCDEESAPSLTLFDSKKEENDRDSQAKLVADFYMGVKALPDEKLETLFVEAAELVSAHSYDAVLFVLKHLSDKIDSLKDLLRSWDTYQKQLQEKLRKIDFVEAKKQHDSDDKELRKIAKKWLSLSLEKQLSSEEVRVLEIIVENPHPRRQLFWAFRFRETYPGLKIFFEENFKRMLPVTTRGKVVKKKDS